MAHKQTEEIANNWDHPISLTKEDPFYKLLKVVASENRRIDVDLDNLYDDRFLDTASGAELEKIGELVGVTRKTNEPDEKLRLRIRGGFAAKSSDTTYDSFTSATLSILNATEEEVDFVTPPESEPKTVQVAIDGAKFEKSPLTNDELVVLLNGALSVDAIARIKITGSFGFAGKDPDLKGFDEGTWSVGINQ